MRVLVTGGTGFTGSHLTRRYLRKGHEVVVLDNNPGLFREELEALGAEIVLGSVTDRDVVRGAVEGCSLVFHLAAMFRKVNAPRRTYWEVNVEGSRNVFRAARETGVGRVVYCSTCGVHGHVRDGPATEESPIAPEDYYQYTKYEAERVAGEYLEEGLPVAIVRPTAIYGPGDPERFLMLFRLVSKGRFLMFGRGEVHYHPVYIDNLVDAFELAAERPEAVGQTYLIGDERYYSLNRLVTAIAEAVGVQVRIVHLPFRPLWAAALLCELLYWPFGAEPPLFRRRVDWFRQNRAFSIAKAKRQLGYAPAVPLGEGLARTARWYRQEGYL